MSKRPDAERLTAAHDKIRSFAAELQRTEGYDATMICDALMAAGINAAVLIAGHEATASCLIDWASRVARGAVVENSAVRH